jgi:hypothetical protein
VNAVLLLIGLLGLSYLGSALRSARALRGLGLHSGAEYLCLGIALGPHALGVISPALLESFEPLLIVGASWIVFIAGLGYGRVDRRPVALGRVLGGVLMSALLALGVGSAVYYALPRVAPELLSDRLLVALGTAAVCSGSTRQAVGWVVQRYAARGPLTDALADYARASALVPIVLLAVLFALFPVPGLAFLVLPARAAVALGLGTLLGLTALMLLSRGLTRDETWGILIGTSLLSMGVAGRLGLSSLAATFALGLSIGLLSRHREQLSEMLHPTERAVLLPVAVLAGGLLDFRAAPALSTLVPLALCVRYALELLRGLLLWASPSARPAGPLVGYALASTGDVTLACAVSIAIGCERPGALTVLAIAAGGLLLGELVAPFSMRRALVRVGELDPSAPAVWATLPPPPPSLPAPPEPGGDPA